MAARLNQRMGPTQLTLRTRPDFERFFDGLEMVEPGVVPLPSGTGPVPNTRSPATPGWAASLSDQVSRRGRQRQRRGGGQRRVVRRAVLGWVRGAVLGGSSRRWAISPQSGTPSGTGGHPGHWLTPWMAGRWPWRTFAGSPRRSMTAAAPLSCGVRVGNEEMTPPRLHLGDSGRLQGPTWAVTTSVRPAPGQPGSSTATSATSLGWPHDGRLHDALQVVGMTLTPGAQQRQVLAMHVPLHDV